MFCNIFAFYYKRDKRRSIIYPLEYNTIQNMFQILFFEKIKQRFYCSRTVGLKKEFNTYVQQEFLIF